MFGINVADAVLIIGAVTAILVAYLGTQRADKAKAGEIAQAPAVNQTGLAVLIDGRVLDRLTIACDRIAEALNNQLNAAERREDRKRDDEQAKVLAEILKELRHPRV